MNINGIYHELINGNQNQCDQKSKEKMDQTGLLLKENFLFSFIFNALLMKFKLAT